MDSKQIFYFFSNNFLKMSLNQFIVKMTDEKKFSGRKDEWKGRNRAIQSDDDDKFARFPLKDDEDLKETEPWLKKDPSFV